MAYGQGGHIGISFQDSFGTLNVSSMDYVPFISESVTEKIESLVSEGITARIDEPDEYPGMASVEGDIVMEVHPLLVGKLLKAYFGQSSQDGYVGSCYRHIFVGLEDDWDAGRCAVPPMTLEIYRDTGSAYRYYDVVANQLTLEIAQGAFYKCTLGLMGAGFAWGNKLTPSYLPGSYYTWDTCSVSLAQAAVDGVGNFTITMNNALEGKAYLDTTRSYNRILRNGSRTVEIAGTMLLEGDTQARKYRDREAQRMVITATDPSTVMGAHNQLAGDFPAMRYTEFPANIGGVGLIEVGFSAKATYDTTSSYAAQFTLVNTMAAY